MPAVADLPQDLIDRVRALSPAQKEALRGVIDAPADGDPELKALLTRRWERFTDGTDPSHSADEVIAELRAQAERRSQ